MSSANPFKKDFPFFNYNPDIVYVDNAATSQKPASVIRAMNEWYERENASAYRGIYQLAERATERCELVRAQCASFIGAIAAKEIAFTKNSTESINIVAECWAAHTLKAGDEIILSELEHHSNILPWQRLAQRTGVVLKWIRVNFDGSIDLAQVDELITAKTKLVAITGYSQVLGNLDSLVLDEANCLKNSSFLTYIVQKAKAVNARVLIDAAQLVPHPKVNVQELGCDFLVFSAHKMLGPQGVGVLYVASDLHDQFEPYMLGGGMAFNVDYMTVHWRPFPYLLEAGTQPVDALGGFGAAIKYLSENIDFVAWGKYEAELYDHLTHELGSIPHIQLLGPQTGQSSALKSFVVDGMHAHDVAAYLDKEKICVRAGNHCAQILHKKLGVSGSVRISLYLYNTHDDIDRIVHALRNLVA